MLLGGLIILGMLVVVSALFIGGKIKDRYSERRWRRKIDLIHSS